MKDMDKNIKNVVEEQMENIAVPQSLYAFADDVPNLVEKSTVASLVKKGWYKRTASAAAAVVLFGVMIVSGVGSSVAAYFYEKLPFLSVSHREEITLNFPELIDAAEKNIFTPVGETVEDNGIRLTITDALYDGQRIALTYTIETDGKATENMDAIPGRILFNGEKGSWSSVQDSEYVSDGKYAGVTDLYVPEDKVNMDKMEVDISFKRIGPSIEGKWKFKLNLTKVE